MTSQAKQCPACNTEFTCCPAPGVTACWCHSYPAMIAVEPGQACRCPDCLAILVREGITRLLDSTTHAEALLLASRYRGNMVLLENVDYTIEAGRLVFTRWYHLKRGSCCTNGCRHCPYP